MLKVLLYAALLFVMLVLANGLRLTFNPSQTCHGVPTPASLNLAPGLSVLDFHR